MIYLDNGATTKPKKEVIKAMMPYFEKFWSNPSSLYQPSVEVKNKIEAARSTVGEFIGAKGNEIFFTSGGSESNCWAIQGFVNKCWANGHQPVVITSTIEHKSILDCVDNLAGAEVHFVGVDNEGFIKLNMLEDLLKRVVADNEENYLDCCDILVSIQYANNEIGTIQSIKEISNLVHKYGGIFHTDAVQAFGQVPINVDELGIDLMSVSGHKVGTPKGVGFLYKRIGININPLIYGSQMDGMRGGTENVPYIIGMAKAVELLKKERNDLEKELKMTMNKNHFISRLREFGCIINGSLENRLLNNINVTFSQNITGESLLYMLDISNIFISTGSACNSHLIEPSHVLKAIGMSDEDAMKTVRFTLSDDINEDLIDKVIEEIKKALKIIDV